MRRDPFARFTALGFLRANEDCLLGAFGRFPVSRPGGGDDDDDALMEQRVMSSKNQKETKEEARNDDDNDFEERQATV